MSPPDDAGPRRRTEGAASIAGGDKVNVTSASPPEVEKRAGRILRITRTRDVDGWCVECWQTFASTGPAASHARSARHQVDIKYATEFVFMPAELIGGTP